MKNGSVSIKTGSMSYIRFGRGKRTLILIPGVGDGFQTVKGMALPFALLYRKLSKDFTVYAFSRRENLTHGTTTRDMAEDLRLAMDKLDIEKAVVVGVSQGGMIAQWLAIDHKEKVEKLVPVVTLSRPNPTSKQVISNWIDMAHKGDYKGIMLDTAERSYSPKRVRLSKIEYGIIGSLTKPASFERFIIQAEACLIHDAFDELPSINCPTLIIGGTEDKIVTGEASKEIAGRIPGSSLYMYEGLSHGLYEEAPDFLDRIISFAKFG